MSYIFKACAQPLAGNGLPELTSVRVGQPTPQRMMFSVTNLKVMMVLPDMHQKIRLLNKMFPLLSICYFEFTLKPLVAATQY